MRTLYDALDEIKAVEDKIIELETTALLYGLATKDEREQLKKLKEKKQKLNAEIHDRTK